jgi:hypothetical protein
VLNLTLMIGTNTLREQMQVNSPLQLQRDPNMVFMSDCHPSSVCLHYYAVHGDQAMESSAPSRLRVLTTSRPQSKCGVGTR